MTYAVLENETGTPVEHECKNHKGKNIEIENAYLTGKQSVEPTLISEAVCIDCGVVVAKQYLNTKWDLQ